jgi:two-component sensor histidine kinase
MDADKPIELWKYHARLRRDIAEQLYRSSELIRQTHHRMANSLQVIASSASHQLRITRSPETADAARRILAKTQSLARAYRVLLFRNGELDLAECLGDLGHELEGLLSVGRSVHVVTEAAPFMLPTAVAAPLIFIAHELVTNAAQHAFMERAAGTINVRLRPSHAGHSALIVADDGIGFPRHIVRGGGLTLVSELADSIGGSAILFGSRSGAQVKVIFPTPTPPAAA